MSSEPDHDPSAVAEPTGPDPSGPETSEDGRAVSAPMAFVLRHRRWVGALVAAVTLTIGVVFALRGPGADHLVTFGFLLALWAGLTVVALLWAADVPRRWINLAAYSALGCWAGFYLSGFWPS